MEQKGTTNQKKSITGMVVGMIAFGLCYFAVQQLFFAPPSFDKVMVEVANELNKTCPVMVDQDTRLDNAAALPDNVFQYNYTLVNLDKSEVNPDTVKKYIEPAIINTVKTNPDMKVFRDNKTTVAYNYRDREGVFVLKISVTPDQYASE